MEVEDDKSSSQPKEMEKEDTTEKMVEINMFDKEGEEETETEQKDGTESERENSDEGEDMPVDDESVKPKNETKELQKFTSADLTNEISRMYFHAFKKYQRDMLTGMDVSDKMEKKSPKFDLNHESDLYKSKQLQKCYIDKSSDNPKAKCFAEFDLSNLFAEIEYHKLNHMPWQLGLYRSCLSSRHFFPPDGDHGVAKLMTDVREEVLKENETENSESIADSPTEMRKIQRLKLKVSAQIFKPIYLLQFLVGCLRGSFLSKIMGVP